MMQKEREQLLYQKTLRCIAANAGAIAETEDYMATGRYRIDTLPFLRPCNCGAAAFH